MNHIGEALQCTACGTSYVPDSVLSGDEYAPHEVLATANRTSATHDSVIASPFKRIIAYFIDMVILTLMNFPLAFLIGALPEGIQQQLSGKFHFVFLSVWILYFFLFEVFTKGFTLGKKLLSIRTVKEADNGYISIGLALVRSIIKIIPVIQIVFLFTDKNKAIHDFAAGTIVVEKF